MKLDDDCERDDKLEQILEIEDEIIVKFCEFNGGMEFAMPIIRNQFEKLNIDFKCPTKEDLRKIIEHLISVTSNIKGELIAKEERKCFKELLIRLDAI
jgi:hypothetical protein